jgi:hypothetical protein
MNGGTRTWTAALMQPASRVEHDMAWLKQELDALSMSWARRVMAGDATADLRTLEGEIRQRRERLDDLSERLHALKGGTDAH